MTLGPTSAPVPWVDVRSTLCIKSVFRFLFSFSFAGCTVGTAVSQTELRSFKKEVKRSMKRRDFRSAGQPTDMASLCAGFVVVGPPMGG